MAAPDEIIRRLEAARGDVQAQAVITADFALAVRPEQEREQLRAALDAAAVLHWFDVPLLAHMLQLDSSAARDRFQALCRLPFVEAFPALSSSDIIGPENFNLPAPGGETRVPADMPLPSSVSEVRHTAERQELLRVLRANGNNRTRAASQLGISRSALYKRLDKLLIGASGPKHETRGGAARNLHEATRIGWRKRLADEQPSRWRGLSSRAAEWFANRDGIAARIEWVYHALSADPESGARSLEDLDREWTSAAHPEDRQALALAVWELATSGLVEGTARVEVLLCAGEARSSRGETAQLGDFAREAQALARRVQHLPGLARACCLLGDVRQAQGKLHAAQAAFDEFLAISRRLAEQDPNNAGCQRDLAVAHGRAGDVFRAQGKLEAAHAASDESLAIVRRLAEQDPSNAGWQRDLAVAHSKVGDVLQAQGRPEAAQRAFDEGLAISRRLVEQDPGSAAWQRDLAVAHSCVGDVLQAQGKLEAAQAAFDEYLAITRRLVEQDQSSAAWQRDLAVAHSRVGDVLQAHGRLEAAQAALDEYLAITRRLAEQDPSNAGWQRDLAVALIRIARLARAGGRRAEAVSQFREAQRILERVVALAPEHAQWNQELKIVSEELRRLQ